MGQKNELLNFKNFFKNNQIARKIANTSLAFLLPALFSILPGIFLYGVNATKLNLSSLGRTSLFYLLISLLIFLIYLVLMKGHEVSAANSAFIFLIFFHTYGLIYQFLVKEDLFPVAHYTLLPLIILVAIYLSLLFFKKSSKGFWRIALLFISIALLLNVIKIIPAEIEKKQLAKQVNPTIVTNIKSNNSTTKPDIYFIIFDEFAGFDSIRTYWNYQDVNNFIDFAKSKGFYVAQDSKSSSLSTFHQLAERLNFQQFPVVGKDEVNSYFDQINNNKVMEFLKEKGYTTIAFEETEHFFNGFTKMNADYIFDYDSSEMTNLGVLFDDFGNLVADHTMLLAFSNYYKIADPTVNQHRDWINFTADKIANLNDISSPKFVYVHLILPHPPFAFDENGNAVDAQFYYNWNYYLGTYKYAIKIAERVINNLSKKIDSANPPVIIIQSDHGARNILASVSGSEILPNIPEDSKYNIMNMMYLPGYNYSTLTEDFNPINTFPIIFNHYFNEDIPLQ